MKETKLQIGNQIWTVIECPADGVHIYIDRTGDNGELEIAVSNINYRRQKIYLWEDLSYSLKRKQMIQELSRALIHSYVVTPFVFDEEVEEFAFWIYCKLNDLLKLYFGKEE